MDIETIEINNALTTAIRTKDANSLASILQTNKNIDLKEQINGQSLLRLATLYYNSSVIKLLIEAGADLKGSYLLHRAAKSGDVELTTWLLGREGIDLNEKDHRDSTALAIAAKKITYRESATHATIIKLLIEAGADLKGSYLLHSTANSGDVELTTWLLGREGIDLNEKDHRDSTPLVIASKRIGSKSAKNASTIIKLLIEAGAELTGSYVLHNAAQSKDVELIKWLLTSKDIDLNEKNAQGETPLVFARLHRYSDDYYKSEVAKLLIEAGSDLTGSGILHKAVESGDLEFITWLLDTRKNIDLNEKNSQGNTPLSLAMYSNKEEIALLLKKQPGIVLSPSDEFFLSSFETNKNQAELYKHPLVSDGDDCNIPNSNHDRIIKSLISHTYSKVITYSQLSKAYHSLLERDNYILNEVMHANSLGHKHPVHCNLVDAMSSYDPSSRAEGYYQPVYTRIVVSNNNKEKVNLPTIIHEYSHRLMAIIFQSSSLPYANGDTNKIALYKDAAIKLLHNIGTKYYGITNFSSFNTSDSHEFVKAIINHNSMLHKAIDDGNLEELKSLLSLTGQDSGHSNPTLFSLLGSACYSGRLEMVKALIEFRNDLTSLHNVLHQAASSRENDILSWLLNNVQDHIDLNEKDGHGDTALSIAALFGNTDKMKMLIEAGADLKGSNVLHSAALLGNINFLTWLLNNNKIYIDLDEKDQRGYTAWDYIKYGDHAEEIEKLFIEYKAAKVEHKIPDTQKLAESSNDQIISNTTDNNLDTGNKQSDSVSRDSKLYNDCLTSFGQSVESVYTSYPKTEEDSELIVRLPEIIVKPGCYEALKDVFMPLEEYWKAEISPVVAGFIASHDQSSYCAD